LKTLFSSIYDIFHTLQTAIFRLLVENEYARKYIKYRLQSNFVFFVEFFCSGVSTANPQRPLKETPPEACDSLGSRPFSKGIAGDSERSERKGTESSLSSPVEVTPPEASDSLGSKPFPKGIAGDSERSERKGTESSLSSPVEVTPPEACDSLGSKPFLKGLAESSLSSPVEVTPPEACDSLGSNTFSLSSKRFLNRNEHPLGLKGLVEATPPLLLYPFQKHYARKLISCIEQGIPLIVEKSEKMGATMVTSLLLLWYWLFKPDSNSVIICKSFRDLYIKSSHRSIFRMFELILKALPECIMPRGSYEFRYNRKRRYYCVLINKLNGNRLYGFSSNRKAFLPKRHQIKAVFFDDFAFHKHADFHWHYFRHADSRIAVSCPRGKANLFYELTRKKNTTSSKDKKAPPEACDSLAGDRHEVSKGEDPLYVVRWRSLHWFVHPEYDQSWYENARETLEPKYISQFINIHYDYIWKKPPQEISKEKPIKKTSAAKYRTHRLRQGKLVFRKPYRVRRHHYSSKVVPLPHEYERLKYNMANNDKIYPSELEILHNLNELQTIEHQKQVVDLTSLHAAASLIHKFDSNTDLKQLLKELSPLAQKFQPLNRTALADQNPFIIVQRREKISLLQHRAKIRKTDTSYREHIKDLKHSLKPPKTNKHKLPSVNHPADKAKSDQEPFADIDVLIIDGKKYYKGSVERAKLIEEMKAKIRAEKKQEKNESRYQANSKDQKSKPPRPKLRTTKFNIRYTPPKPKKPKKPPKNPLNEINKDKTAPPEACDSLGSNTFLKGFAPEASDSLKGSQPTKPPSEESKKSNFKEDNKEKKPHIHRLRTTKFKIRYTPPEPKKPKKPANNKEDKNKQNNKDPP